MAALSDRLWSHGSVRFGVAVLGLMVLLSALAPWLGTVDPAAMDANHINKALGSAGEFALPDGQLVAHQFWLGTDSFGRDVYSRVLFGGRISLVVGVATALLALALGGLLGMLAGYFKQVDMVLMRIMDGLMAIPAVLLAIALVAALGANVATVVIAIAIPEVPRVTRLVRSLVLTLREEPYVEAARALATPTPIILWRHILPNAMAPLLVQGTFVAASAVLTEAILSFLGLGLPPDVPTWGNIMAEGRTQFSQQPGHVLFPALFLVPTVLAINLLGDGLRDVLDPKLAKRVG
ncbi:MAG: Glutathione transport system permease protein GsiD [Pseudomonadota bacterium]|jgi:peptide/nickel transport system permease protein